jgi:hypothetical protein
MTSDPNELSIPTTWKAAPLALETADPASTSMPGLDEFAAAAAALHEANERSKRIFATCRWAGIVAVTEMSDGYDAAMRVVAEGPAKFLPTEDEWDRINTTARIAINYVESGATP